MSPIGEPSISTHVLDVERGEPARGFEVTLSHWEGSSLVELATAVTNEDGRVEALAAGDLRSGTYRLAFDAAGYFRRQGREVPFTQQLIVDFRVGDPTRRYHVPLLLSPYACTLYRGS